MLQGTVEAPSIQHAQDFPVQPLFQQAACLEILVRKAVSLKRGILAVAICGSYSGLIMVGLHSVRVYALGPFRVQGSGF